jgi:hypothetical protein
MGNVSMCAVCPVCPVFAVCVAHTHLSRHDVALKVLAVDCVQHSVRLHLRVHANKREAVLQVKARGLSILLDQILQVCETCTRGNAKKCAACRLLPRAPATSSPWASCQQRWSAPPRYQERGRPDGRESDRVCCGAVVVAVGWWTKEGEGM